MPRPRKTLFQLVLDGTFTPSRHGVLLDSDDSLLPYLLDGDADPDEFWLDLASAQLYFRAARSPITRRRLLHVFAAAARGNLKPYVAAPELRRHCRRLEDWLWHPDNDRWELRDRTSHELIDVVPRGEDGWQPTRRQLERPGVVFTPG